MRAWSITFCVFGKKRNFFDKWFELMRKNAKEVSLFWKTQHKLTKNNKKVLSGFQNWVREKLLFSV